MTNISDINEPEFVDNITSQDERELLAVEKERFSELKFRAERQQLCFRTITVTTTIIIVILLCILEVFLICILVRKDTPIEDIALFVNLAIAPIVAISAIIGVTLFSVFKVSTSKQKPLETLGNTIIESN